jgi:hypothetical protein
MTDLACDPLLWLKSKFERRREDQVASDFFETKKARFSAGFLVTAC